MSWTPQNTLTVVSLVIRLILKVIKLFKHKGGTKCN